MVVDSRRESPRPIIGEPVESDESLAARAASDADAFAEIYRRYAAAIRRYCGFRLRNPAVVEDVTSEVFMRALESLHKTHVRNVRQWLYAIAHNLITDRYRRTRDEVDLALAEGVISPVTTPEEWAVARTQADELWAAIAMPNPDQARVLKLRLAGLDGPEIRAVLNKSRSWVDTTQYRALIRLRALIAPEQEPEERR